MGIEDRGSGSPERVQPMAMTVGWIRWLDAFSTSIPWPVSNPVAGSVTSFSTHIVRRISPKPFHTSARKRKKNKKRHAGMPSATSVTLAAHAHRAKTEPRPLRCAYVTFLLTSPSYLPGILLLAHTLRHPTTSPRDSSAYPLIVAVNPALPGDCIKALEDARVEVRRVEPLVPSGRVTIIAERFVDTWTKLRVWEFGEFDVSASPRSERAKRARRGRGPDGASEARTGGTRITPSQARNPRARRTAHEHTLRRSQPPHETVVGRSVAGEQSPSESGPIRPSFARAPTRHEPEGRVHCRAWGLPEDIVPRLNGNADHCAGGVSDHPERSESSSAARRYTCKNAFRGRRAVNSAEQRLSRRTAEPETSDRSAGQRDKIRGGQGLAEAHRISQRSGSARDDHSPEIPRLRALVGVRPAARLPSARTAHAIEQRGRLSPEAAAARGADQVLGRRAKTERNPVLDSSPGRGMETRETHASVESRRDRSAPRGTRVSVSRRASSGIELPSSGAGKSAIRFLAVHAEESVRQRRRDASPLPCQARRQTQPRNDVPRPFRRRAAERFVDEAAPQSFANKWSCARSRRSRFRARLTRREFGAEHLRHGIL